MDNLKQYLLDNCTRLYTKDFFWIWMGNMDDPLRKVTLEWNLRQHGLIK